MERQETGLSSGIKKFDGTEFEVWSILMEGVLDSKGLWFVMEQIKPEAADARNKWDKADRSARTMIMLSLEHDIVKAVMTCTTASQMWNKLKTIHSQKSESSKMILWKEYYDCKMDYGVKVSDYVTKLEFIAMKLRNIGEEVTDNNLISKIVSGLSSDYKHFMSNWLATPQAERTFDNLLPRLLAEESINTDSEAKSATAMKMVAARHSKTKPYRGNKVYKNVECSYCEKKGHTREECRSLKRDEKDRPRDRARGKTRDSDVAGKKYAVIANSGKHVQQSWLMDSGASFHMTGQRHWISNYRQHSDKVPIRVGNNEFLHSLGSGTVEAYSIVNGKKLSISLTDVHYVPGISDNLFSQGAVDDKGIKVVTNGGSIQLIADGKTIITGSKGHGNLYRLNLVVPMQANVARTERTLEEWHRVLGHPDINEVKNLEKKGCTVGFKIVSGQTNQGERCGDCQNGKCTHASHPNSRRERAQEVLGRVHVDLVGPIDPPSLAGSKYFMLVRDEYSSYMHVFFLASKTQVLHAMTKYLTEASTQSQRRVKIVRSDNGTEFKNTGMKLLFESEGIIQEFSVPLTAQQNGEIERANRTIIETARTMLCSSKLPISLWGEAVLTAVYLRNRVTNKRSGDKTPFELFHGKAPDYSHLIEFGRELQALDTKKGASKFSSKTKDVYMVGYGDRVNVYRIYNPRTNDVDLSSDVVIANHTSTKHAPRNNFGVTFTLERDDFGSPTNNIMDYMDTNQDDDDNCGNFSQTDPPIDLPNIPEEIAREQCTADPPARDATFLIDKEREDTIPVAESTANIVPTPPRSTSLYPSLPREENQPSSTRRFVVNFPDNLNFTPRRVRLDPKVITIPSSAPAQAQAQAQAPIPAPAPRQIAASTTSPSLLGRLGPAINNLVTKERTKRNVKSIYARNLLATITEPLTYAQAVSGESSEQWRDAIAEELEAHSRNSTWLIVPKTRDTKEITAKWVFKIKSDTDGSVNRFKARLVARGFSQQQGIDYKEIFSPVVRTDSVRLLFSVCAQYDLDYKQFDITTAFLYGNIEEELYMKPPEGLNVPDGSTCKLQKSLYGLKQAPRCWNAKFSKMLEIFNMRPTSADPCVYVAEGKEQLYLALYVDDGLIFAKNKHSIDRLLGYLTKHFMVKTVDSSCFIGIEIKRNRENNSIFLHQTAYINKMLHKFNMADAKGVNTPLEVGHPLNKAETLAERAIDDVPYAEAIGSLLYCAMATRPDLAYPLSVLSKYTSQPRAAHWQAVKRVLRYLRSTPDYGIVFQQVKEPKLTCYSDADWAGDHENRRSTSGLVSFINTGPISFRAQQQPVVALSTTEAEYIAATLAVKDLIWIQRFIEELNLPIKSKGQLFCDNQSALKLMKNPEFHQRSKHIDIRFHFIREKYEEGLFNLDYICTEKQKADVFTKALTADRFRTLRKTIGCISLSDFDQCDERERV